MSRDRTQRTWSGYSASSRLLLDMAADRPIDWRVPLTDDEMTLVARHGLLGLMAHSDHPLLAEPALGPYARLAARQQAMEEVLELVLENLANAHIPATVLKGPALARWAYREPRHRTYTDVDLLIPAARVSDALDVLSEDERTVAIPAKTPKADKRNIPMASRAGVRFTLDLHWDLFSYSQLRGCASGAVDEAWSRATWDPDNALGPMWRLPQETLIAFLATHALLDHRFRLILFRDLVEVSRLPAVDWESYLRFSRQHGLCSTGYLAWLITSSLLDAPVPKGVLADLRPRGVPVRAAERLLPRIDPVTFDGHKPHPLNLAVVLSHDRFLTRLRLAAAAPIAYPEWLRKVAPSGQSQSRRRRFPSRSRVASRPRVLHLLPLDLARGAQTYARAMREALDGAAVEHRTATIFGSDPAALEPDFDLGTTVGWGRGVGFSVGAFFKLAAFVRRWKPEVVVAHGGEAVKYAALAVPRRTSLVYYKIGTSVDLWQHPFRRFLHGFLTRRANLVAGVSQDMVGEAMDLLDVDPSVTTCIPNARDPNQYPRRDHRIDDQTLRFISVGHVNTLKRPDWFVDTVEALRRRGVACEGWWVGDGPLLEYYRTQSPDSVTFLGRREDIPTVLSESHVFVLTSVAEGMPGVLIEAGLVGLPTVATDAAGLSDVVKNGVTGYVVPQDDWPGLVSAAEQLARDAELRERMGKAAHEHCLEHFTLEASADLWRNEIERLLTRSGRNER